MLLQGSVKESAALAAEAHRSHPPYRIPVFWNNSLQDMLRYVPVPCLWEKRRKQSGCRSHRNRLGILRPEGHELLKNRQKERFAHTRATSETLRQALERSAPAQVPAT